MRKILVLLLLAITAVGLGASAAPALASNCTMNPLAPGVGIPNITTRTTTVCDSVWQFQVQDELFIGGSTSAYDQQVLTVSPHGAYNGNIDSWYPCPHPGQFWWGHRTYLRALWVSGGTWGPWHVSVDSGGTFGACS